MDNVHADQFLTDLSLLQTAEGMVGDMVFPVRPVDHRTGFYEVFGTEHFKQTETLRRPGAAAYEANFTLSKGTYSAQEYSQSALVPAQIQQNADNPPIDPKVNMTIQLTELMKLDRERRQMQVAGDPTQITQNLALSGTSQWSDYVNSVPLTNIKAARSAVRAGVHREANTITLSYDAALTLADHPSIKDLIKYVDPQALEIGGLPPTLRGLKVIVSEADQDTTAFSSQTPVFSPVFSKAALIHYTDPNLGLRSISLGVTFEVPDAVTGQRALSVRQWFDEARKGDFIEVSDSYAVKVLAPLAGYLFTTCIA